eukprot:6473009-Amphidinium_carterae.1
MQVQWAQSTTRMTSRSLSALLEGQRLAQVPRQFAVLAKFAILMVEARAFVTWKRHSLVRRSPFWRGVLWRSPHRT